MGSQNNFFIQASLQMVGNVIIREENSAAEPSVQLRDVRLRAGTSLDGIEKGIGVMHPLCSVLAVPLEYMCLAWISAARRATIT